MEQIGNFFGTIRESLGGIGLVVAVLVLVWVAFMVVMNVLRLYRKVAPNQALIISGRRDRYPVK